MRGGNRLGVKEGYSESEKRKEKACILQINFTLELWILTSKIA